MRTVLLALIFVVFLPTSHAEVASFQLTCNSARANTVVEFTLSGVHFVASNLQTEDESVKISNDHVLLSANDGTQIILGEVVAKSSCGADGNLTAEVLLDQAVQLHEGLLTQSDCHAINGDNQFAVDQAFKIHVVSGNQMLALETEYTSVFPTEAACRASYQ
jgi:hypothetical protein